MKNNKALSPDGIPIEFYKALFCNEELLEANSAAGKCLKLIFNKILNGSFLKNGTLLLLYQSLRKVTYQIVVIIEVFLSLILD